jgi:DNA-binding beta-propeller fold protein YncE
VAILDANASLWGVAISSDGTIYFTEQVTHRVRMVRDGQVTTVAGSGVRGYADGAALKAKFKVPRGLAISPNGGAIYVADCSNNRIRMIRDGQVTTVAGSGKEGYADGAALQAQFYNPTGLAISPNGGAIYVADDNNNSIRMIRDGQVTTVAGSGVRGYADGAALQAQFNGPTRLAISPNRRAIYVADCSNNRIRMIRDGQVTTVAGSGVPGYADGAALQAQFNYPTGLAISPNGGAIYVADYFNNRIRMICDGQVTTVAGSGVRGYAEGAALQAQFNIPAGLAISPNGGAIYVADCSNNRIRMIRDGHVATVAGRRMQGYADGAALQAQFNYPAALAIPPNGRENAALQAQFNYPAALAIPPNGRENAALQAQFNYPLALAIPPADHYNKQMRMIGAPNVFSLQNSAVDLRQAIDAQPSLFIKIGDISLGFHECLIAHRCPQLKQVLELTGSSLTIEARAVRALQSFVYTDTLPDQQKLCSVEWLCLMVWLHMFVIMMNLTGGGCIDAMWLFFFCFFFFCVQ